MAEEIPCLDDLLLPLEGLHERNQEGLLAVRELHAKEVVLLLNDANFHPGHRESSEPATAS